MLKKFNLIIFFVFLLGSCCYGFVANAASILINPVVVKLQKNERITNFSATNSSTSEIMFELKAFKWLQKNGDDILVDTQDIIITPPIITIPPGKTQIIRVGLRHPKVYTVEETYRIILQELPIAKELDKIKSNAIRVILRFNMPFFIAPIQSYRQVNWKINKISANKLQVKLINKSNEHVAISELKLSDKQGTISFLPKEIFARILSNKDKKWLLNLKRPIVGNNITILATTDWEDKNRELNAIVPVE